MKTSIKYILAAVTALVILRSLKKPNFKQKAVKLAKKELERWNFGNIKEGNAALMPTLRDYYKTGTKTFKSDKFYIETAWSGAFISFIMRMAGAGDKFKYANAHAVYIQDAKQNRKKNIKTFQAFRKNEVPVTVGDLICYPRQDGVTYDTPGLYYSHCDIVSEIKPGVAVGIGGNVSNSVKSKNYTLDSNNKVTSEEVHAIIKVLI
jgi:hypothetical protein